MSGRRLLTEGATPRGLGAAVALGVFLAFTPLLGLQTILAGVLGGLLGLNRPTCAAVNLGIAPVYPMVVVACLQVGNLALHGQWLAIDADAGWGQMYGLVEAWVLGGVLVGIPCALLAGGLTWVLARGLSRSRR